MFPFPRPYHLPIPTTTPSPGTTPDIQKISEADDKLASDIGIKVPSGDCITSWNDFKADVSQYKISLKVH